MVQNSPNFLWSGAVERVCRKNRSVARRWSVIFKKFRFFLVFFMNFSRIIAQKGPKRAHITPDALTRCLGTVLKNIKCRARCVQKFMWSGGAE
jgi:hypothetical protein